MHIKEHRSLTYSATFRPQDWLRFVEIEPFPRLWASFKLTDEDLRALQTAIMALPQNAAVIPGGGGLRKLRFSKTNSDKGKSGSYRVYYVYFPDYSIVLLMAIVDKTKRADLNKSDVSALSQVISRVKALLDRGVIR